MKTPMDIAKEVMDAARSGPLGAQHPDRTEALIANAIGQAMADATRLTIQMCAAIADERTRAWEGATAKEREENHFGTREDEARYIARTILALAE